MVMTKYIKTLTKQVKIRVVKSRKSGASTASKLATAIGRLSIPNNSRTSGSRAYATDAGVRAGAGYCGNYLNAVLNPFSDNARGIQNPDGFMFPTDPRAVKGKFQMGPSASGGPVLGVAVLPNPLVSVLDLSYFANGPTLGAILTAGALSNFGGNNPSIYGACSSAALSAGYESFRLVAGGVKLRVVMPELTRTGTVTCAPFVCTDFPYGVNMLTNAAMTNANMYSMMIGGILPSVASQPQILELPGAFELSLNDLSREDIILPFKPSSMLCQKFHSTQTSQVYNSTQNAGTDFTEITASGTLTNGQIDTGDDCNGSGFVGWLICVDGIPTTSQSILQVEYVYHLEGVPLVALGAASVPIPDTAPPPPVSAVAFGETVRKIYTSPMWSTVSTGLENMGVSGAARGFVRAGVSHAANIYMRRRSTGTGRRVIGY